MQGGYAGGIVLVAANTIEQAFELASLSPKCDFWFNWETPDGSWAAPKSDGAILRSDYYPFEKWREYEHLSCDYTEPQVILEESHAE
jgi:hypothetical protein